MAILKVLDGYKTYIVALGLFTLAIFQISIGQYAQATQSIFNAFVAAGLRHAISKSSH